jgi:hypothetical protein
MDLRGYNDKEEDKGDNRIILDASPLRFIALIDSFDARN